MVDVRHSILIKIIALSDGKTLSVDDLTEHLERDAILFLAFDRHLCIVLGLRASSIT